MNKVFISGSIQIKKLSQKVLDRIDKIVDSELEVIVGDAKGVDSSIQNYLKEKHFNSVKVYCSGAKPRNNLGEWSTNKVSTDAKPGTRAFFTAKDRKMAEDCDYGFMIWDSKSTGTLSNTVELLKSSKYSVVFINKLNKFLNIKTIDDLEDMVSYMSESDFIKADKKLSLTSKIESFKNVQTSLF